MRVAKSQKKWITPALIIQTCPKEEKNIRVGYTASKKVGNAVLRNKAKRRMRELVKQVFTKSGRIGYDYVLIARPGITQASFKDLIRDLKWSLKRLHDDKVKGEPAN